ncbi:hypothetical protein [Nonomuraea insulae]|uniref:Ig-like domain-containing protein n=1 Tax=Nonomuraea insulae TaxID=1616787 RepID=A0ABW1CN05_9ACTN
MGFGTYARLLAAGTIGAALLAGAATAGPRLVADGAEPVAAQARPVAQQAWPVAQQGWAAALLGRPVAEQGRAVALQGRAASPPSISPTWGRPGSSVEVHLSGVHCPTGDADAETPATEPAEPETEADGPFEVLWDGEAIFEGMTDKPGGLHKTITVPGAAAGEHTLNTRCTVSGTTSRDAVFTVVPQLKAAFRPSSGRAGEQASLAVNGLHCGGGEPPPPGGAYTVRWGQGDAPLGSPVTADSAGADFTDAVTVPEEAVPGPATVTVACANDSGTPAVANFDVQRARAIDNSPSKEPSKEPTEEPTEELAALTPGRRR